MTTFDASPTSPSPRATAQAQKRAVTTARNAPLLVFLLVVACLPLLLVVTITQPIGPMYWDHFLYLDAANRIDGGQIPNVDFFTPVGALGYYLFTLVINWYPKGHPLLIANWSLLLVSAPLMAFVIRDVQKRSTALAFALALPFLFLSILPFNTGDYYPYPGSDGFGIYNRQICQLLYVLAAILVFVEAPLALGVLVTLAMLSLLFVKVTGVAAGVVLCVIAFAAGRLPLRVALAAGLAFFGVIGVLQLTTGIPSAYLADILGLVAVNDESLLPRLMQAASLHLGIVIASSLLCAVLLVHQRAELRRRIGNLASAPSVNALTRLFDMPFLWLGAFIFAGILFESQNTGSQGFVFLWPLLLKIGLDVARSEKSTVPTGKNSPFAQIVWVLILAAALPPVVTMVQKSGRAWVGMAMNMTRIESRNLKTMGAVADRPFLTLRAERMRANYIAHRDAYQDMTNAGELHSFLLFSDFDFQDLWLTTLDEAIDAVRAYETRNGVHFATMMDIDFTSPLAWLMDRQSPKYITIGADPFRAVAKPDQKVWDAVAAVDLALLPTCPPTTARKKLTDLYQPMLAASHTRITLTDCFDAFVRKGLTPSAP